MGEKYSVLVSADPQLADHCLEVYTNWEGRARSEELTSLEELVEWGQDKSFYLSRSGPEESDVKGFYRENGFVIMLDFSMTMLAFPEEIARLSMKVGDLYGLTVQSTAGFASFQKYSNGKLVREIIGDDGTITITGDDAGSDKGSYSKFYFPEIDDILKQLGLTPVFDLKKRTYWGIQIWDKTDYAAMVPPKPAEAHGATQAPLPAKRATPKPWWRLW